MDETKPEDQRARSERALKSFLDTQSKVVESTARLAKAIPELSAKIGDGRQGLVAAVADLIDAVDDLKNVIGVLAEVMARGGGTGVDISEIFEKRKRR